MKVETEPVQNLIYSAVWFWNVSLVKFSNRGHIRRIEFLGGAKFYLEGKQNLVKFQIESDLFSKYEVIQCEAKHDNEII